MNINTKFSETKKELKQETMTSKTDIETRINMETKTLNDLIETKHSEAVEALEDMKEKQKPIAKINQFKQTLFTCKLISNAFQCAMN